MLYFQGHFVRALGKIGDKDTENEVLLLEHDVPHSKFSEAVLSCLPKLPWVITEKVSAIFFFFQVLGLKACYGVEYFLHLIVNCPADLFPLSPAERWHSLSPGL